MGSSKLVTATKSGNLVFERSSNASSALRNQDHGRRPEPETATPPPAPAPPAAKKTVDEMAVIVCGALGQKREAARRTGLYTMARAHAGHARVTRI